MKCEKCAYLSKSSEKCELCGHKLSESKKGNKEKDEKFYRAIWKERDHICEVCTDSLGDTYNPVFFSHILTKKSYPRFRHYHKNVLLKCFECHHEWEFTDRKKVKWNDVRDLEQELIEEYYTKP